MWRSVLLSISDLLRGRLRRARARLGFVKANLHHKVIWIKADANPESIMLAAELLGAIRHARLDVFLLLSFERDCPEIYRPRLQRMEKFGLGFGPDESPSIIRRVLRRWHPVGIITVRQAASRQVFAQASQQGIPCLQWLTEARDAQAQYSYFYADSARQRGNAPQSEYISPWPMLVNSQIEPTLQTLMAENFQGLFLLQAASWQEVQSLLQENEHYWKQSSWQLMLCCADSDSAQLAELVNYCKMIKLEPCLVSSWQREKLAHNALLILDDKRWHTAAAAAAQLAMIYCWQAALVWQLLALGKKVILVKGQLQNADMDTVIDRYNSSAEVWECLHNGNLKGLTRAQSDSQRQWFWQQKRKTEEQLQACLKRIYNW